MNCEESFKFCEQQVQDLLLAIETIEPVIGSMGEYSLVSQELEKILSLDIKYRAKIEAYKEILDLNPNKALTKVLESKISDCNNTIEELALKCKEDEEYLVEFSAEIEEYFEYIQSFTWLNVHHAAAVFSKISEEDKTKYMAALLLFTNESISDEDISEIAYFLSEEIEDQELKEAILALGYNENALVEYIVQTYSE